MNNPQLTAPPRSCDGFWAELETDRRCQAGVAACGVVLCAAAAILLLAVSLPLVTRLTAVACLAAASGFRGLPSLRAQRGVDRVRIFPGGRAQIRRGNGWHEACVAPGSLVLSEVAWLRVRQPGRQAVGLLFLRARARSAEWRRFQVISRHVGA